MTEISRARPRPRSDDRAILGTVLLLLLIVLGLWAYANTRPKTATAVRRDIVVFLPLAGEVVAPPTERADVMAPYRAPVAKVYVSVGDKVKRGDVLAELALANVQTAYEQAREAVKAAQLAYESAQRQYGAAVAGAKKKLEAAQLAERQARATVAAGAPPPESGVTISDSDPTQALAAATAARIEAEQALLQAQAEMEAALTPYRQRLQAAQETFQAAQAGRKQALIRSPVTGTVLALNARPSEEVGRDTKIPVAIVVNLSALQVHAAMSSEEADAVKVGETAILTFREIPGKEFEGRVARITTAPPRPLVGPRMVAIVDFKNDDGLVKPDMKASVRIKLGEAKNALVVPSEAVDHDKSGRPFVDVLRGGRWQSVVVEIGLSDGRYTAIRSGLNEGDTVKVTPSIL